MYPPPPPIRDTLKSRPGQVGLIIIFLLEESSADLERLTITPLVSFLSTSWVVELVPIRLRMRGACERKRSHRCGRFVAFDLKLCFGFFYRTRVRSLVMLVSNSLTHWLTDWLLFSKLDRCDPEVWRYQLKTCWGCYCCWCWCWGSCWQQLVDLGADVWS